MWKKKKIETKTSDSKIKSKTIESMADQRCSCSFTRDADIGFFAATAWSAASNSPEIRIRIRIRIRDED
jgi:hypothetical protein